VSTAGRLRFYQQLAHPGAVLSLALLALLPMVAVGSLRSPSRTSAFIASIDTMKVSRDTATHPETASQIAQAVDLCASLNTTYITVDTNWEYPAYMKEWIDAIRAAGKHVWFRTQPNQWHDDNGATGIMSPSQFESAERSFIDAHPGFFRAGDIFDPISEPEDGLYWNATFPSGWSWRHAPNTYTNQFNRFILQTTEIANRALKANGVRGVITNIRSVSGWWAASPKSLYNRTVDRLGNVTFDSYPEGTLTDPTAAAHARLSELAAIHAARPDVPVIVGEMGYSDGLPVSDAQQESVIAEELTGIRTLGYVAGLNYWVGPGTSTSGGYTHIFAGRAGAWTLRPAANDLASFFRSYLSEKRTYGLAGPVSARHRERG